MPRSRAPDHWIFRTYSSKRYSYATWNRRCLSLDSIHRQHLRGDRPIGTTPFEEEPHCVTGTGGLPNSRRGTALVVGNVNRYVLKPILKKLGLPYGTSHASGHGGVSRYREAGVHSDLITKWVGGTSLKMTSKYKHFSAKHRKDVMQQVGFDRKSGSLLDPFGPFGPNVECRISLMHNGLQETQIRLVAQLVRAPP
jgi:hypothetical protein